MSEDALTIEDAAKLLCQLLIAKAPRHRLFFEATRDDALAKLNPSGAPAEMPATGPSRIARDAETVRLTSPRKDQSE